jgi:hypothetical protein
LRQEHLQPAGHTHSCALEHRRLHRRRRCDLEIREGRGVLLQVRDLIDAAEQRAAEAAAEAQRLLLAAARDRKGDSSTTRRVRPMSAAERRRQRRLRRVYGAACSDPSAALLAEPAFHAAPQRLALRYPKVAPPVRVQVGLSSLPPSTLQPQHCHDPDAIMSRCSALPPGSLSGSSLLLPTFRTDRLLNFREEKTALQRRAAASR